MKKIIYIIIICNLQFAIYNLSAQWVQQVSGTNTHLIEVRFINQYTGWACGLNGIILKTTNEGINWLQQYTGIYDKPLWRVRPVNENVVYCVGGFETFLKTTNGGTNWQIIKNGPLGQGHSYEALFFINQNTGWYCGTGQLVFKTTNGGITMDSVHISGSYLFDIYFKDSSNGLICGQTAAMFKTSNGGQNWLQVILPVGSESANFYNLAFVGDTGWVIGQQNNKVYKTSNFGTNWDSLTRVIQNPNFWNSGIFFTSSVSGWITTNAYGTGRIYKTSNGGYNWFQQVTPDTIPFSSVFFTNDSVGWCACNYGVILHTTNGGTIVKITNKEDKILTKYELLQNYPNPFNSETLIEFYLPQNTFVTLKINNVLGQLVDEIKYQFLKGGKYRIKYYAVKLSSGIYFYTLYSKEISITKKFILLK